MPRQTEPSVNNAMEHVLQGMLSRSHVRSENTQTITGHPGLRPDILIEDPGRAPVVIEAEYLPGASKEDEAGSLTVLNYGALCDGQFTMAELIFDEFRDKKLQPAYLADADPNRTFLDRSVICDLLGFDEQIYTAVRRLAAKLCAEPSVHGGEPRPKDANLMI